VNKRRGERFGGQRREGGRERAETGGRYADLIFLGRVLFPGFKGLLQAWQKEQSKMGGGRTRRPFGDRGLVSYPRGGSRGNCRLSPRTELN